MKNQFLILTISLVALALCGCARLLTPIYSEPPPGSTNTPALIGYVVNTNAPASLAASAAQQAAPLLPQPAGVVVGGLGAIVAAGLGAYARFKSRQALQTSDILNAVVAGVEAAGKSVPANIAPVKSTIATHVAAAGYTTEFDQRVQNIAKNIP